MSDLAGSLGPRVTPPVVLTVAEVADRLRVSKMTIYRLIADEELPAFRVGRTLRIPERGFTRYLDKALGSAGGEG